MVFRQHGSRAEGIYGPKDYEQLGSVPPSSLFIRGPNLPYQWGTLEVVDNQTYGRSRIGSLPTRVIQKKWRGRDSE